MSKNEQTSKRVAKIAGKLLKKKSSTRKSKSVYASALTQAKDRKKKK